LIIVDAGFWFGLMDRGDRYHDPCRRFLAGCQEPLVTTFPVLTEALHLLMRRSRASQSLALLAVLDSLRQRGQFSTFSLHDEHWPRLRQLMAQYRDLPMDLADASLVLLAEQLGDGRIVSTDQRDFHTYRWKSTKPFTNLLDFPTRT
jgi:predicted nucleic acid-binding protein